MGAGALNVGRLAIVASDPTTSAALRLRLNAGSQWVSHLLQELAFACLNDSAFAASLTASQRHYQQQNQQLAAALARHGAGDYPPALSAASQPLALRLARAGWLVREGEAFGVKTPAHGLRLSLGALTEAQIEQLAHDLSLVLPC